MSAPVAAALLVIVFAGTSLLRDALPSPWSRVALFLPALLLGLLAFELARYDHGHADALFWIAFVGAPLAAIFGGAAWGSRRFYGWPDLGKHPPRAAAWAAVLMLGVLVGTRVRVEDVAVSEARAEPLRAAISTWLQKRGTPPTSMETVCPDPPSTRMGWLDPPAYVYGLDGNGRPTLSFPLGGGLQRILNVADGTWRTGTRAPATAEEEAGP